MALVRRAAVAELAEARTAGGLMRAARMGITAEDISLIGRSTAVIRAGRLLAADEVAFNSQLGRIRMIRSAAGNPRLILRGATEPFAEVLAREGRIRLFNGHIISLHNDIYSVEARIAVVRQNPWITPNNTVATLRQGDLLVRLNEQNGWYQVSIVQAGQELSGFMEARLLVPLVLLAARDDRKKNASPHLTIAAEERARWDYYWATPGGNDVPEVSASDAMSILFHRFGQTGLNRRIAYSEKDWPIDITSFVRMTTDNLPILSVNRFKDKDLRLIGFTKDGELLQYLAFRNEGVKLNNPSDWGPKNYGEWYQVRTLDGDDGWVFAKPYGQAYSTGQMVKRCLPARMELHNTLADTYRVIVDGAKSFEMSGKTARYLPNVPVGRHTVRVIQLSGYWFWATDEVYDLQATCGGTVSVTYH